MKELDEKDVLRLSGLIDAAGSVAILTHVHPDGDALGSSLGMARFLTGLGRSVTVILPTPAPATLDFIPGDSDCPIIEADRDRAAAQKAIQGADLVICQDFCRIDRAEGLEDFFRASAAPKVLIDHHQGPDRDSFDVVFSETEISSASELVFWVLLALPQTGGDITRIPGGSLEALMTGMTTDTNNFANSTFPSTMQMASMCIAAGVDRDAILSNIYNRYRENRFRLLGYVLSEKLKITPQGVAYVVLSRAELDRFDIREGETEAFVNQPLGIGRVRMSFFLKEEDGVFRVSIRSKKGTSASSCARQWFNGGGHENASGGKLVIGPEIPDAAAAERYIVEKTEKFFSDEK